MSKTTKVSVYLNDDQLRAFKRCQGKVMRGGKVVKQPLSDRIRGSAVVHLSEFMAKEKAREHGGEWNYDPVTMKVWRSKPAA